MNVAEFRKRIKFDSKLIIEGEEINIKQLVKFRLSDGSIYLKLFLDRGFVLADDLDENIFILVKEIETDFKQPFPKKIVYSNKEFRFTYDAHATAEEVEGDGMFKVGDSERFWDYEAADGSYLSLGLDSKTGKRMDLTGKIISSDNVEIIK